MKKDKRNQNTKAIREIDSTSCVIDLGKVSAFVNSSTPTDINALVQSISTSNDYTSEPISVSDRYRGYVPWGTNNDLPYKVIKAHMEDEVLSQNMHFNALTCYGSGLRYTTRDKKEITDTEILDFFRYNRPVKYFLDQCHDMKNFLFSVSVIIVNTEGSKIVKLRHKEAVHCRFETCNPATGIIEHLFYGDWEDKTPTIDDLEVIPVLDYYDPIGDLLTRFGKLPNDEGKLGEMTEQRKFAIINIFPTVGKKYYPIPPAWSNFKSGWYEYKRLIPLKKITKLKNTAPIKYQVEINKLYWQGLFESENITDPEKQRERRKKEFENIKDFLLGLENSNKVWITGFYVDPHGKENQMIRITVVDQSKEGGELIEDSAEASNMACYAAAVHPALIGASPGKSQGNFSGSVQRELFTIKQALEKPYHDILLEPYQIISIFNEWGDIMFDIPVITLTTLDKGADATENTMREPIANT